MSKLLSLLLCCFLCARLQAQHVESGRIQYVEVHAMDPHVVETFARVGKEEIVNDNGLFHRRITARKEIDQVCRMWNRLQVSLADSAQGTSVRMVLRLVDTAGGVVDAELGNMYTQEIVADGQYCRPDKEFYKLVFDYLPGRWRKGADPLNPFHIKEK